MTSHLQTACALAIAACALAWLVVRALSRRSKPGCGGGCACPGSEIKARILRDGRPG